MERRRKTGGKEGSARRNGRRGFTLLEVLIATAILGVAVVTLLGLHARNLRLIAEAEELTVAGALAGNVLSAARLEPFLDEGTLTGTFVEKASDADGRTRIHGGRGSSRYRWSRDVTPTALPTLRQMRVRVFHEGEDRTLAEFWSAVAARVPRWRGWSAHPGPARPPA